MSERKQISIVWYAVTDFLTASLAWGLYFFIRKAMLQMSIADAGRLQVDYKFWFGITLIPAAWLVLYSIVGTYHGLYKKPHLFHSAGLPTVPLRLVLFSPSQAQPV